MVAQDDRAQEHTPPENLRWRMLVASERYQAEPVLRRNVSRSSLGTSFDPVIGRNCWTCGG